MTEVGIKCIKRVGGFYEMCVCGGSYIRHGYSSSGKLRMICKKCRTTRVNEYSYRAYHSDIDKQIVVFVKEGLGIRSIARILKISTATLLRRIRRIAAILRPPYIFKGRQYEVDEIKTFVGSKKRKIWIAYALERESRQVVSFKVGSRNNATLKTVLQTLFLSEAKTIYTDKFPSYRFLIPESIHRNWPSCTNHIERKNLNLRTHLKRLNRRTICYSKSAAILAACVKIYFWG
ncbi:IS1 family transposase [Rurimicrobium arvi]|uniref:IS1 family transposase n=1 Tax=Rurimicrobium arvi TaxID=2049916 RepID=UPI0031E25ADF